MGEKKEEGCVKKDDDDFWKSNWQPITTFRHEHVYFFPNRTSDEPQHDLESSRRVHYEGLKKVNYGLTS